MAGKNPFDQDYDDPSEDYHSISSQFYRNSSIKQPNKLYKEEKANTNKSETIQSNCNSVVRSSYNPFDEDSDDEKMLIKERDRSAFLRKSLQNFDKNIKKDG